MVVKRERRKIDPSRGNEWSKKGHIRLTFEASLVSQFFRDGLLKENSGIGRGVVDKEAT